MMPTYDFRKLASGQTLLDHKQVWARELADLMAARFSSAGGWRDHYVKTSINRTRSGCTLHLESELGWSCGIDIVMEDAAQIDCHFNVSEPQSPRTGPGGLPDLDDLDLTKLLGKSTHTTFPIKDREPMAKGMMDVSLWISKQLPRH